jgi:hypothetical protein
MTCETHSAGQGASDYERYLRTDELLALQKSPGISATRMQMTFRSCTRRQSCC